MSLSLSHDARIAPSLQEHIGSKIASFYLRINF